LIQRGTIYVAADSNKRKAFIDSVFEVAGKNQYEAVFSPWDPGYPQYITLLDEILAKLSNSDLIVMDITMDKVGDDNWVLNYGVWAEYSMWAAMKRLSAISVFAEESCPLEKLHPFVHKKVTTYSLNNLGKLKKDIQEAILAFDNWRNLEFRRISNSLGRAL